jgi:hypothetical protein
VHLVWQDAVPIAILSLIAWWHAGINPAMPAILFGATYLLLMSLLLPFLRQRPASVALGFLWPALLLPKLTQETNIGLFVAIAAVVWYGHWKSFKAFPWDTGDSIPKQRSSILHIELQLQQETAVGVPANIGWPFTVLGPKIRGQSITTRNAFWLSALFGWWSYCVMQTIQIEPFPEIMLVLTFPLALFRYVIYCSGLSPSFNVLGRFATNRIILPGYDKVHLTSLAALLISMVGSLVIRHSGAWYVAAEAIGIAVIWFVMLAGGPTKKNWILTGQHRFRFVNQAANRRMMREV